MSSAPGALDFLSRGGDMGELIRAYDLAKTPIGPPETWSPALRMVVRILLANCFPQLLWWGPDHVSIYNDAYRPILGRKHPWGLGKPVRECWSEIWEILRPLIDTPFEGGPSTWSEDIELAVQRAGFTEETHFTIAYSPVPDDAAPTGIGGVLATVHEITEKVIGERRIVILRDLGTRGSGARTAEEACEIATRVIEQHAKDIPFALIYLIDPGGNRARLAASCGFDDSPGGPAVIDLHGEDNRPEVWPLVSGLTTEQMQVVDNLSPLMTAVPQGPWTDPPNTAVVIPLRSGAPHQISGFLVAGIRSRLKLDAAYQGFLELATSQIATAIANARAYEEDRRRAEALSEIDRAKTAFFSNVSHEFRIDLAAFTADLASNFWSAMNTAGLELLVDCTKLPETVYVDREMWEKIVLNLLSNAFKFTFEGRVTVRMEAARNHAVLTVADTGTGSPEAELPHIFERFHRVEGARGRTHEGTGAGLALIQELVKLHGGTIHSLGELQLNGKPHILIVEDNRADVFLIRDALKTAQVDADIYVVQDGHAATEFFDAADSDPNAPRPALVLLDMNLPKKNGDEVLKHLRKSPCCWQAIVLIISSSQTPRAKAAVRDLGVAAYFQKSSECASVMKLGPLMKQLLERSTSSGEVQ